MKKEPKYKDLKFKTKTEFETWLKKTTKYKVYFEDKGQDFLVWWIDKDGEVLHSDMQSWLWNGRMVEIKSLKVKGYLKFVNGDSIRYKIKKIEGK